MAEWVVDSSSLITLAGAGAIQLLARANAPVVTVPEVYRETVETGKARAFPDAGEIAGGFEKGLISIRAPRGTRRIGGVSPVDSRVLLLAEEIQGAILLVNDQTLLRKAEQRGIASQFTAEFVRDLQAGGKISRRDRDRLFEAFLANGRYSEPFLEALLQGR